MALIKTASLANVEEMKNLTKRTKKKRIRLAATTVDLRRKITKKTVLTRSLNLKRRSLNIILMKKNAQKLSWESIIASNRCRSLLKDNFRVKQSKSTLIWLLPSSTQKNELQINKHVLKSAKSMKSLKIACFKHFVKLKLKNRLNIVFFLHSQITFLIYIPYCFLSMLNNFRILYTYY